MQEAHEQLQIRLPFNLFACREVECDRSNRCNECKSWNDSLMIDYLKHRRSLDQKGGKKPLSRGGVVVVVVPRIRIKTRRKIGIKTRIGKNCKLRKVGLALPCLPKLESFSKQLLGIVGFNPSLSAPHQVSELVLLSGQAGSDETNKFSSAVFLGEPPGARPGGTMDPLSCVQSQLF